MLSIAILLFLIMDPFGNVVVVNSLLDGFSTKQKGLILLREGAIAFALLVLAAFFGRSLLEVLAVEDHSLQLTGGIVLFLIALGMVFPSHITLEKSAEGLPLIVPIATPLIAGPSALSMVMLFSDRESVWVVSGSVALAAAACTVVLMLSASIYSAIGQRGAVALERLMGMLLIMISVQMILDGIGSFLDARVA